APLLHDGALARGGEADRVGGARRQACVVLALAGRPAEEHDDAVAVLAEAADRMAGVQRVRKAHLEAAFRAPARLDRFQDDALAEVLRPVQEGLELRPARRGA